VKIKLTYDLRPKIARARKGDKAALYELDDIAMGHGAITLIDETHHPVQLQLVSPNRAMIEAIVMLIIELSLVLALFFTIWLGLAAIDRGGSVILIVGMWLTLYFAGMKLTESCQERIQVLGMLSHLSHDASVFLIYLLNHHGKDCAQCVVRPLCEKFASERQGNHVGHRH
jgi:hypothetical protein